MVFVCSIVLACTQSILVFLLFASLTLIVNLAACVYSSLQASGVVGIFPAGSEGDDIRVFKDDSRSEVAATFCTLRQQAERDGEHIHYALSDFIAPAGGPHR